MFHLWHRCLSLSLALTLDMGSLLHATRGATNSPYLLRYCIASTRILNGEYERHGVPLTSFSLTLFYVIPSSRKDTISVNAEDSKEILELTKKHRVQASRALWI